jgi:hypothetical protein
MRRSLTAMSVAAAVVLLTACSGSDDASSSPTSRATTSGASETSAPAADSEFCTDAAAIQERVTTTFSDQSDLASLPQSMQETAVAVREVEPPAEIAADWAALAAGLDQIAAALSTVRLNDPNAVAAAQQELIDPLLAQFAGPSANVAAYLRDQCGLDVGPGASAAPTS